MVSVCRQQANKCPPQQWEIIGVTIVNTESQRAFVSTSYHTPKTWSFIGEPHVILSSTWSMQFCPSPFVTQIYGLVPCLRHQFTTDLEPHFSLIQGSEDVESQCTISETFRHVPQVAGSFPHSAPSWGPVSTAVPICFVRWVQRWQGWGESLNHGMEKNSGLRIT